MSIILAPCMGGSRNRPLIVALHPGGVNDRIPEDFEVLSCLRGSHRAGLTALLDTPVSGVRMRAPLSGDQGASSAPTTPGQHLDELGYLLEVSSTWRVLQVEAKMRDSIRDAPLLAVDLREVVVRI